MSMTWRQSRPCRFFEHGLPLGLDFRLGLGFPLGLRLCLRCPGRSSIAGSWPLFSFGRCLVTAGGLLFRRCLISSRCLVTAGRPLFGRCLIGSLVAGGWPLLGRRLITGGCFSAGGWLLFGRCLISSLIAGGWPLLGQCLRAGGCLFAGSCLFSGCWLLLGLSAFPLHGWARRCPAAALCHEVQSFHFRVCRTLLHTLCGLFQDTAEQGDLLMLWLTLLAHL
mmetsp:Transcript_142774/g.248962  ORF Transcript_142774/g.248962 Transcript_142774/m.248962 type:complete len:222 (+) Transcript_142774:102-767(+)